jgi:hypothetical protein
MTTRVRRPRPAPQQQPASPPRRQASGSLLPVLLLGAKLGWPLVGLAVVAAIGGGDASSPELTASAKIDAEQQIMGHIATAGPAIERRLAEWLTARDGLLYLREPPDIFEPYAFHVLPVSAPWRASCGELGLIVTIASYRKELTEIALDERQCGELLTVLGRAMRSLTEPEGRPAPQPRKEKP